MNKMEEGLSCIENGGIPESKDVASTSTRTTTSYDNGHHRVNPETRKRCQDDGDHNRDEDGGRERKRSFSDSSGYREVDNLQPQQSALAASVDSIAGMIPNPSFAPMNLQWGRHPLLRMNMKDINATVAPTSSTTTSSSKDGHRRAEPKMKKCSPGEEDHTNGGREHISDIKRIQEKDYYDPPTSPPIVSYSDHEAGLLRHRLQDKETFEEAVYILRTWLERGDCKERNAGNFFSLIKIAFSHIHNLIKEHSQLRGEVEKAKMRFEGQIQEIAESGDFEDLLRVLCQYFDTILEEYATQPAELEKFRAYKLQKENAGCSVASTVTREEARLIAVLSIFLNAHPFGANLDYICSYLHDTGFAVASRDIEAFMRKFSTVFREELCGVGASLRRKFFFRGFQS